MVDLSQQQFILKIQPKKALKKRLPYNLIPLKTNLYFFELNCFNYIIYQIKVKNLTINLLQTWGDKYYIGLNGLEIYDNKMQKIVINNKNLNAKPRDLNSTPGFEGDPRILENLIDPENITVNDKKIWLIQYIKGKDHAIYLNFQNEIKISGSFISLLFMF